MASTEKNNRPLAVTGVIFQFSLDTVLFEFSLAKDGEEDETEEDQVGCFAPRDLELRECEGESVKAFLEPVNSLEEMSKVFRIGDEVHCTVVKSKDIKPFTYTEEEEEVGEDGTVTSSMQSVEVLPSWKAETAYLAGGPISDQTEELKCPEEAEMHDKDQYDKTSSKEKDNADLDREELELLEEQLGDMFDSSEVITLDQVGEENEPETPSEQDISNDILIIEEVAPSKDEVVVLEELNPIKNQNNEGLKDDQTGKANIPQPSCLDSEKTLEPCLVAQSDTPPKVPDIKTPKESTEEPLNASIGPSVSVEALGKGREFPSVKTATEDESNSTSTPSSGKQPSNLKDQVDSDKEELFRCQAVIMQLNQPQDDFKKAVVTRSACIKLMDGPFSGSITSFGNANFSVWGMRCAKANLMYFLRAGDKCHIEYSVRKQGTIGNRSTKDAIMAKKVWIGHEDSRKFNLAEEPGFNAWLTERKGNICDFNKWVNGELPNKPFFPLRADIYEAQVLHVTPQGGYLAIGASPKLPQTVLLKLLKLKKASNIPESEAEQIYRLQKSGRDKAGQMSEGNEDDDEIDMVLACDETEIEEFVKEDKENDSGSGCFETVMLRAGTFFVGGKRFEELFDLSLILRPGDKVNCQISRVPFYRKKAKDMLNVLRKQKPCLVEDLKLSECKIILACFAYCGEQIPTTPATLPLHKSASCPAALKTFLAERNLKIEYLSPFCKNEDIKGDLLCSEGPNALSLSSSPGKLPLISADSKLPEPAQEMLSSELVSPQCVPPQQMLSEQAMQPSLPPHQMQPPLLQPMLPDFLAHAASFSGKVINVALAHSVIRVAGMSLLYDGPDDPGLIGLLQTQEDVESSLLLTKTLTSALVKKLQDLIREKLSQSSSEAGSNNTFVEVGILKQLQAQQVQISAVENVLSHGKEKPNQSSAKGVCALAGPPIVESINSLAQKSKNKAEQFKAVEQQMALEAEKNADSLNSKAIKKGSGRDMKKILQFYKGAQSSKVPMASGASQVSTQTYQLLEDSTKKNAHDSASRSDSSECPLDLLRQFLSKNMEIIEEKSELRFGDKSFAKSTLTNLNKTTFSGCKSSFFYSLHDVWFMMKHQDRSFESYSRIAEEEKVNVVNALDRGQSIPYLSGRSSMPPPQLIKVRKRAASPCPSGSKKASSSFDRRAQSTESEVRKKSKIENGEDRSQESSSKVAKYGEASKKYQETPKIPSAIVVNSSGNDRANPTIMPLMELTTDFQDRPKKSRFDEGPKGMFIPKSQGMGFNFPISGSAAPGPIAHNVKNMRKTGLLPTPLVGSYGLPLESNLLNSHYNLPHLTSHAASGSTGGLLPLPVPMAGTKTYDPFNSMTGSSKVDCMYPDRSMWTDALTSGPASTGAQQPRLMQQIQMEQRRMEERDALQRRIEEDLYKREREHMQKKMEEMRRKEEEANRRQAEETRIREEEHRRKEEERRRLEMMEEIRKRDEEEKRKKEAAEEARWNESLHALRQREDEERKRLESEQRELEEEKRQLESIRREHEKKRWSMERAGCSAGKLNIELLQERSSWASKGVTAVQNKGLGQEAGLSSVETPSKTILASLSPKLSYDSTQSLITRRHDLALSEQRASGSKGPVSDVSWVTRSGINKEPLSREFLDLEKGRQGVGLDPFPFSREEPYGGSGVGGMVIRSESQGWSANGSGFKLDDFLPGTLHRPDGSSDGLLRSPFMSTSLQQTRFSHQSEGEVSFASSMSNWDARGRTESTGWQSAADPPKQKELSGTQPPLGSMPVFTRRF